jgi:phosphoadenosine phosphosulfate reductase
MAESQLLDRNDVIAEESVAVLNRRFEKTGTRRMLETILQENAGKRVCVVSSFGSNSVVLLHLVAGIDKSLPVLFIDTGKLFADTHRYREKLAEQLGLEDVRLIAPDRLETSSLDPYGALWMQDRNACCNLRKVRPFAKALENFDIWISGRKRYQGGARATLPMFENEEARLKINPLANWTRGDIDIYRNAFSLPQHPLVAQGYGSIGCEPCTSPIGEGEDERAGRWRGLNKTECGIHIAIPTPATGTV